MRVALSTNNLSRRVKCYGPILLLAAALVILGDRVVGTNPPNGGELFGDALVYTIMANGDYSEVSEPFRYRVLVPSIAWLLPFSAVLSLKLVSYAGLFLFYFISFVTCRKLGVSFFASFLGLATVYSSVWYLYNYQNPYLTDTMALAFLSLIFLTATSRNYPGFLLSSALGIVTREASIFLAPIWLVTRQWRKALLGILVVLLVYYLHRLIFASASDDSGSFLNRFQEVDRLSHLSAFARPVIVHWGFSGGLAILGIVLVSQEWGRALALGFGALIVGAVISSF